MRVLLTRAAEDAARTSEKLVAAGHEVLVSPVIEFVGTGVEWPRGVVDAVVATSAQAFAALGEGPSPECLRLLPVFLVGERTAERARERGFAGAMTVAPNAAALVLRFGSLRSDARAVYLAGRDRKPEIETAMVASGRSLTVIEVYEARAVNNIEDSVGEAIRTDAVDVVLHFSPRSASLFEALSTENGLDISRTRHLCLSEEVAAPLRQRGLPHIDVAATPSEEALLALLSQA